MDIRPIRNDEDHRAALAEIKACWGAPEGTEKGDKLDVLVALVESYEARRWPIEPAEDFDPVDVLHHAIDEFGHSQSELAELLALALALARVRGPCAQARAHHRYDPQDRRGVENSGRSAGAALQDREGGLRDATSAAARPAVQGSV
jgi:antitoxin component HigA of HigAB toxin-antitoxin module